MKKKQKHLVNFLIKYSNNWNSYSQDHETVSLVCACYNLGILKLNEFGQMKLKSIDRANQFLNQ